MANMHLHQALETDSQTLLHVTFLEQRARSN